MNWSRACVQPLRDLIDDALPVKELERLARVDALLRIAAARDRDDAIVASRDDCERICASDWPPERSGIIEPGAYP
jgi:hypothetical protein